MNLTENEKIVFKRIWQKCQPGNVIYDVMSVPEDIAFVEALVEKGLIKHTSIRFVRFTETGVEFGLKFMGHI